MFDEIQKKPSNHDSKLHGWLECKVLNIMALVCNGKISGYGTWRWSPDSGTKKTVEDRMRALSLVKHTLRTKRLLGAFCAHVELTQRTKGVTAQLAENECGIPVFECVPLIGQWKETTLVKRLRGNTDALDEPRKRARTAECCQAHRNVATLWGLMMRASNEG